MSETTEQREPYNPYDLRPIYMAKQSDLDMVRFAHEYLPKACAPEILEADDRSLTEQLAAAKMIASVDDPTPTLLGLLVLGKRTRYFLPCAYIQFLRIDGFNIPDEIVDAMEIDGTVSETLRRIKDKLNSHNRGSLYRR